MLPDVAVGQPVGRQAGDLELCARPVVLGGSGSDAQRAMKHLADASLAIDGTLDHVDQAKLAAARYRYRSAVLIGKRETAARASPLMRKHHALARRLPTREDDYLCNTRDPRVPFDNNAAEREVRMSKLRIKVSDPCAP